MTHIQALRALRLNYRWSGVWAYLRSPDVRIPGTPPRRAPGWVLFLCCPSDVYHSQVAFADGAFL